MAADVTIEGAESLHVLAAALRRVGDKELRRELFASLQRATKPTRERVRSSLGSELPHRGGLAAVMGASKVSTKTRTGGRNPGVRIEAVAKHDVKAMDRGSLRHPLWGKREKWVTQQIKPGAFSDPIREDLPHVQAEILEGMRRVAEQFLSKHG